MEKSAKKMGLISLAIPILVESVLRSFMGTINISLLGNYSDSAVAAVGVSNQIMNVVIVAFNAITAGTAVLINQYIGAKKEQEANQIGMNAMTVSFMLGCAVTLFLTTCAMPILRSLSLEEALLPDAAVYLRWMGGSAVMTAVSSLISVLFRCHGNAKVPMFVVMIANVINVTGTYLVVNRPFEIPLYGVSGVAVVRFSSDTFTLLALVLLLIHARYGYQLRDLFRFKLLYIKRILGIGLMTSAEGICYTTSQVVTTSFLTAYGMAALSTKTYVQNIEYYAYIMGSSLGQAAQILSGHMMGAGETEKAYKYINKIWRYVVSCNILFGTLLFVFSDQVMGFFTSSQEIIQMAKPLLAIDIAIHIARSFNHTHNQGLRAAVDVFWPMIIAISSIWVLNVGLSYVFTVLCKWGIIGIWLGAASDEWFRGLCVMTLWQTKKWKASVSKISRPGGSGGAFGDPTTMEKENSSGQIEKESAAEAGEQ